MSDYCSNVLGEKRKWGVCKEVPLVSITLWQKVPSLRCVFFSLFLFFFGKMQTASNLLLQLTEQVLICISIHTTAKIWEPI